MSHLRLPSDVQVADSAPIVEVELVAAVRHALEQQRRLYFGRADLRPAISNERGEPFPKRGRPVRLSKAARSVR
jgi:hypothetical protein